jgi:Flp pilus assembly protein TadD
MIRNAVKQRPRDGYIIDSLGWVLYRLGNAKEAVKQLERAVQIRPEDPTINDHLGDIYWAVGRRNEATFQWKRALTLGPEVEQIPKIKLKLKDGLPEEANKRKRI